ncbi:MAG TPA: hypothetical protein VJV78_13830 [Polyangiales bacterium]|nr:hypothetical protein [Polyangiales bacterium]
MSKGIWFGGALLVCALAGGCLERELIPLNPCLVSGVARSIEVSSIDKLDLLFVVDNSQSMAEEQAALNLQFPRLIKTLTSGMRADGRPFPAVRDMHLGVVSSDMGLAGIPNAFGCDINGGDDGVLQHKGGAGPNCAATYPSFLSFERGVSDPDRVANDFGCIASLGTKGCGFEQQLEAGLKALWPKAYTDKDGNVLLGKQNPVSFLSTTADGQWGHGDGSSTQGGNAGFLRNDAREGISIIAVVVVTDEEDCSSIDTTHFTSDRDDPRSQQPVNLRCFLNKQNLFKVDRYVQGFKALRPNAENLVIFGAIAGVPPDLVSADARARYDLKKDDERTAYYDAILNDPRMQERRNAVTDPLRANLEPSCFGENADGELAAAYPPVRIVEVAKAFGKNGVVQSICQKDFGPAMDVIIDAIIDAIPSVCLPRPLVRGSDDTVRCNVIWELPAADEATTGVPTECAGIGSWLSPADPASANQSSAKGKRCVVQQLPVHGLTAPQGQGWYYDDFSDEVQARCQGRTKQRVSFTESARPGNGVKVKLECLNETQRLRSTDPGRLAEQPEIGSPCADLVDGKGQPIPLTEACAVNMQDGSQDRSMFCHGELNVCVRACQGDSQCPPAWVCDARPDSTAQSGGQAYCVNPTCGSK